MRNIYSIYAIKLGGKWKKIPEIEYIYQSLKPKREPCPSDYAEALSDFEEYRVNLFYKRNRFITAFVSDKKMEAFDAARQLALVLNADILDAT